MNLSEKFNYWMKLNDLTSHEVSRRFKISQPYFNQIVNGKRKPGQSMAEYLDDITNGFISKKELRPDIW